MKILKHIHKFFEITGREQVMMLEAFYWLVIYTFLIYVMPFRWWQESIGQKMQPLQEKPLTREQLWQIREVRRAVFRANKVLFGLAKCFALSLTLKKMLQKRGMDSTLYLGVKKNGHESLLAHAWLKCGDITVYGGRNAAVHYRELLTYT